MVTHSNASVSLNFTGKPGPQSGSTMSLKHSGTGVTFGLSYSSAAWTASVLVNSTIPPSSATQSAGAVTSLPYGRHFITLNLSSSNSSASGDTSWARLNGVTGDLGTMITAQTVNQTIDDTAWRNWTVVLTPGWNMLEQNASNWINTVRLRLASQWVGSVDELDGV
jgi:hypothetical protein